MASRIAGITIEIDGNTTKLTKALDSVNKEVKGTQTALKDVDKLLKLDPSSTELLTQKEKLLKQAIEETKDKLKMLQDVAKSNDLGAAEHDKVQREIAETEQNLESLENQLKDFGSVGAQKMKELGNKLSDIGDKVTAVGKKLSIVSAAVGGLLTVGIKYNSELESYEANLSALLGNADDAKALLNDLKQMASTTPFATEDLISATQTMMSFGISVEDAQKYLTVLGDISLGDSEKLSGLALVFGQVSSQGKLTGQDLNQMINNGFNPLQYMAQMTGKSMSELKQEMSDGAITAEMVAEAFEYATTEGQPFFQAMEKGSKTLNGELSTLKDNFKEALGQLTEALLPIIKQVVEFLTKVIEKFSSLSDGQKKVVLIIALLITAIGPLLILIGQMASGIGALVSAVSMIAGVAGPAIAAIAAFGPEILAVVAIIGSLIYAITHWEEIVAGWGYLFGQARDAVVNCFTALKDGVIGSVEELKTNIANAWENIKSGTTQWAGNIRDYAVERWNATKNGVLSAVQGLKDGIVNTFNSIVEKIKSAIDKAKETVRNGIQAIKNFFAGLKIELPKIKLPHFRVTGKFSLNPLQVPSINVDWYKKAMNNAMVLNSPTIFGMMGGKMLGGGEAGAEVISGESHLMDMIGSVVDSRVNNIESMLATYLPRCAESMSISEVSSRVEGRMAGTTRRANAWA